MTPGPPSGHNFGRLATGRLFAAAFRVSATPAGPGPDSDGPSHGSDWLGPRSAAAVAAGPALSGPLQ